MNRLAKNIGYKYCLAVIGLLSFNVVCVAQSIRQGTIKQESVTPSKPVTSQPQKPATAVKPKSKDLLPDTVYCHQTKKQHGWFAPLGIITKEAASHRNQTYRFTNRNSQGNWCKMEVINGYGDYTTGSDSPYILKTSGANTDTLANTEWAEKIKTVCIYEFIADPTGKEVIQERAYDKDMNIVYTYSRTPIGADSLGHNRYVGSYKDIYGLPAEMRKDTTNTYTYGTLVMLTEDIWGNDSIVEYMDAKGRKKLNSEGVAMEVFICDKEGHLLKQQSRDAMGNLTIDNWGNCGIEYEWNADHTLKSATYMDDKWQPMQMPSLRETFGRSNVIKMHYEYDEYKRQEVESYFTDKDVPDVNSDGIHKVISSYDNAGNPTELKNYDLDGNLINDASGTAVTKIGYNKRGQLTNIAWFNKDNEPLSTGSSWSRAHYEYDKEGNELLVERYVFVNGKEKLSSKKETTSCSIYQSWSDGSYRKDSIDGQGRTLSITFYDAQGNLEKVGDWAKKIISYTDGPNHCYSEISFFDESNNPIEVNGASKRTFYTDSISNLEYTLQYDSNNILKDSYYTLWNSDYTVKLAELDANAFGVASRSGGTASVRHYVGDVLYNQKGNFASLIGKDEFHEPDYIVSPYIIYYYQRITTKGENLFYDENNNEITDFEALRDSLPKIMTIEVVDSSAYRLGLRDNDVIIQYGDYSVDLTNAVNLLHFRTRWSLGSILNAQDKKKMVVFRIEDAEKGKFGLVEIDLPAGTPSELGFLAHIRYLTQKQKNRIWSTIKANEDLSSWLKEESLRTLPNEQTGKYIVMGFTDMYRAVRNKPYAIQVTDPAIVLGAYIKEKGLYWYLTDNMDNDAFSKIIDTRKEKGAALTTMNALLTKDMKNVVHFASKESNANTIWFDTYISNDDYDKLLKLFKVAQNEMSAVRKSNISPKDLMHTWEIVKKEDDKYSPEGYLSLAKNGVCAGTIYDFGRVTLNDVVIIYKIQRDYAGEWSQDGNLITITPSTEHNVTLSCVDIYGDEDLKGIIPQIDNISNSNKERFLGLMVYDYLPIHNGFFITEKTKDTLVVEDGSPSGLKFIKTK